MNQVVVNGFDALDFCCLVSYEALLLHEVFGLIQPGGKKITSFSLRENVQRKYTENERS